MNLPTKNKTAISLMVVSMVLLTAFQLFWLRKEYKAQKNNLFSQADLLFKQTIRQMEDDIVLKSLNEAIKTQNSKDSIAGRPIRKIPTSINQIEKRGLTLPDKKEGELKVIKKFNTIDITNEKAMVFKPGSDSGIQHVRIDNLKTFVTDSQEIFTIKTAQDSSNKKDLMISIVATNNSKLDNNVRLSRFLGPMRSALRTEEFTGNPSEISGNTEPLILNFSSDSIILDSLKQLYSDLLNKAGIDLEIKISKDEIPASDSLILNNKELISGRSTFTDHQYYATLSPVERWLFSKILSQIGFSFLLLGITGISFSFIYRSLKQQHKLNTIKNDLIGNISHELKTPLTTVSVALEALQNFSEKSDPALTKEYLEITRNEVNRLTNMVDNILQSSIDGASVENMSFENTDLVIFIQKILDLWKPRFEKEGIVCNITTTGNDLILNIDKLSMNGVINNLIDNAIKYGGEPALLEVNLEGSDKVISISIKDNGPGISKEYKEMIFDKFFRVPKGNVHTIKGYGLGLNYVRNIVGLHNGTIELAETSDKGSEFVLKFNRPHSSANG